jgi:EpsI family protein
MKIDKNTIGFAALIVMLAAACVISLGLFTREMVASDKLDVHKFPMVVGEWTGRDLPITEKEYDILETRNLITREYVNPSGDKLYLFIIYSETNRSVFHPPEVCMIGSGMDITDKQVDKVESGSKVFTTNKLFAEKGQYREIILNSYMAGKLHTDNFYLQQAYLAGHQIFGRVVPGATLRVSMSEGGDRDATLKMLKGFLSETAGILDELSSR